MIQIKGYQIIKKLGQGGMATVYLAKEESLDREVALKILTIHVSDEVFKNSFLAEARLVAQLEHQHIIKIYRINIENDQFYMEMELLRQGTLKERLDTSALNVTTTLSIIQQISSALAYAHNKGYIHRDIKPANILFRNNEEVVLADFGIAKTEGTAGDLTIAGHSGFGTPNYMAPEQAMGDKVDGRTDLYSLGIIFYEMLIGKKPFKASNTVAIIQQHMTADIPTLPSVYEHFQPILNKALAKNKDERYADVLAFSEALLTAHHQTLKDDELTNDTIPYQKNDQTAPYAVLPVGEQAKSQTSNQNTTYTRNNATKPWNIPCKQSSALLVISFIDIVGSTKLSEKYGDFVFSDDIRQNFERIINENIMDSSQGVLVKSLGDGVLLIYSDTVYAIENSIRIQQALRSFLSHSKTPKFQLRIGLNLGEVTLENDTTLDVHGVHVNKASRIEGYCKPGLVAMSHSVYDIAYPRLKHHSNLFWKNIGEKKLKGIPDKERIHLVSFRKISSRLKHAVFALLVAIISAIGIYFAIPQDKKAELNKFISAIDENYQDSKKKEEENREEEKLEKQKEEKAKKEQEEKEAEEQAAKDEKIKREAAEKQAAEEEKTREKTQAEALEKAKKQAVEQAIKEEREKAKKIQTAALEKARKEAAEQAVKEEREKEREREAIEKKQQEQVEKESAEKLIKEKREQEAAEKNKKKKREQEKNSITNTNNEALKKILSNSFLTLSNVCMNYNSYKKADALYKDMKKLQRDYAAGNGTPGISSSSRNMIRMQEKKEKKQALLMASFKRLRQDLSDIKSYDSNQINVSLNDFARSEGISSLSKKKFKQAIRDENSNVSRSRGNDMNYYKKICK